MSDPRRKSTEPLFLKPIATEENSDYMAMLSFLFGFLGIMFKIRAFTLNSLLFCIATFVNMKVSEDWKQHLSAISIVVMGLIMAYRKELGGV